MPKKPVSPDQYPCWYDGKRVNEVEFTRVFLAEHPMCAINGRLFTLEGPVENETLIRRMITESLQSVITSGLAKRSATLLDYIRLAAFTEPLPLEMDRIHLKNGVWHTDGHFEETLVFCNNRLPVIYDANAPTPQRWLDFLSDILEADDILTLQEYMGYCLIPSTKAQKMMILIGKGGEGKSRIGQVLMALMGAALNTSSIQKVETNSFARADLEHKLLMVDDDMDMNALPKTNYIKSIVTAEGKMDLERKGMQSYQNRLYCRFLCFSNGALASLYDHTDGFYRRQLILTTKDRPKDRVDDPYLTEKLLDELPGILLWCLEGLKRLLGNAYRFTVSKRAANSMDAMRKSNDNILEFLDSDGYIAFDPEQVASSKLIYEAYVLWCEDNAEKPYGARRLFSELMQHAPRLGITPTNNIHLPGGKRVRGFIGVEAIRGAFMPPIR